ncbi:succinylglutamate desuccinylase/aspartoacylase family protein [Blastomonas sp.]|uniref:succinylglutamate desuccinylase/aspartoacylase family protein n=1 Tax=Blastomonas sp. TaxID=1909299 RepID=UPI0035930D60
MTDQPHNLPAQTQFEAPSSAPHPFMLAGTTIAPGTCETVAIAVSNTATGIPANLYVRAMHGSRPGPAIFVSAAVHGDEIIGTAVVQRLLAKLDPTTLAGTVLFMPVVNIFGFMSHSRYLPDRRDLNRSFPGSTKGSLAGQLAHKFLREVICHCALGIDIHSAAVHRYNLPQIRIEPNKPDLRELAMVFGAHAVIESPLRPGSLRDIAREAGVDMLLMEAGEALRFDELSIRSGVNGVLNVMAHLKMIKPHPEASQVVIPARSTRSMWVRAPRGGVCSLQKKSGDAVNKGDVIGRVADIFGYDPLDVRAPIDGIIIGHAVLPVVNQGDALVHIAEVMRFGDVEERVDQITEQLLSDRLLDEDELI